MLKYVFEGMDYTGKTTLIQNLKEALKRHGSKVGILSLPHDANTTLYRVIRSDITKDIRSKAILFLVANALAVKEALEKDYDILLIDRYYLSTLVYNCSEITVGLEEVLLDILNGFRDVNRHITDYDGMWVLELDNESIVERAGLRDKQDETDKAVLDSLEHYQRRYRRCLNAYLSAYPNLVKSTYRVDANRPDLVNEIALNILLEMRDK